jgi:hypothetical protein
MSRTNKSRTILSTSAEAVMFVVALLLCGFVSFGQLKVNPKTIVTVNNIGSSKGEAYVFDSCVLGADELFLKGVLHYFEAAGNTSLIFLIVANADELTILTELKTRGNLDAKSGILVLQKVLHSKGDVIS